MTNTEIQILDFSRCWVFDRYIANDEFTVVKPQEIEFDWFAGFGLYQDFESLNQHIPGYAARAFHFVAPRNSIDC